MNAGLAWLLIGVPAILIALALLLGRSPARAGAGFAVLAAAFAAMTAVDRISGVFLGGVLALLYAAGRSGEGERGEGPDERTRLREASARQERSSGK